MKIIKEQIVRGKRRITVELADSEQLTSFNANCYYQMGQPLEDDVLTGDMILNADPVFWCVIEQKWSK